jgi:hypothetical protein
MSQYIPKYFKLPELVHPDYLNPKSDIYTPEWKLWLVFDPRILQVADYLREKKGPIYVNAKGLTSCGLRRPDSKIKGTQLSAHLFGRALDMHIVAINNEVEALRKKNKLTDDQVHQEMIKLYDIVRQELINIPDFSFLNFEKGIYWLHTDSYNRPERQFNP